MRRRLVRLGRRDVPPGDEAASVVVAGEVDHDRAQVGGRPLGLPDPVAAARQPDEGLLHQVLRGGAVVGEPPGDLHQPRRLGLEEGGQHRLRHRRRSAGTVPSRTTSAVTSTPPPPAQTRGASLPGDTGRPTRSRRRAVSPAAAARTSHHDVTHVVPGGPPCPCPPPPPTRHATARPPPSPGTPSSAGPPLATGTARAGPRRRHRAGARRRPGGAGAAALDAHGLDRPAVQLGRDPVHPRACSPSPACSSGVVRALRLAGAPGRVEGRCCCPAFALFAGPGLLLLPGALVGGWGAVRTRAAGCCARVCRGRRRWWCCRWCSGSSWRTPQERRAARTRSCVVAGFGLLQGLLGVGRLGAVPAARRPREPAQGWRRDPLPRAEVVERGGWPSAVVHTHRSCSRLRCPAHSSTSTGRTR